MRRKKSHTLKFCSAILNYDYTSQIELYITGVTVVFIDLQALSKHWIKPKKNCKVRQFGNWAGKFAENVEQFAVRKKHPLFSCLSKEP